MAAQEFSSPGAHMSGSDPGISVSYSAPSSQVAFRNPNNSSNNYDVGNSPIYYGNINKSFEDSFGSRGGSVRDYSDFIDSSYNFNRSYMDYNDRLFSSAMEYDKMMSNTAIQRQVQDLIKAGLNPILASRLGGATYHGVVAPYVSVNPGSSLQAFTGYDSSVYNTDISSMTTMERQKLENDSKDFIAQFNKTMDRIIAGDKIQADKDIVELKKDADKFLSNLNFMHDKELQSFGIQGQKALKQIQYDLDKNFEIFKKTGYDIYNRGELAEGYNSFFSIFHSLNPLAYMFASS